MNHISQVHPAPEYPSVAEPSQVSFFLFPRSSGSHPAPIRLGTGSYADVYRAQEVVVQADDARQIAIQIQKGTFTAADERVLLCRPCAAKVLNRDRALDDGGLTASDEAHYLRDLVGQPHVVQLLGAADRLPPIYICGNPDCDAGYAFHEEPPPGESLPCGCKLEFLIAAVTDSPSCIFLECLDTTLRDYIQKTRTIASSITRCITVFECLGQTALGIAEIHRQGRCHLDVATRNLMLRWQTPASSSAAELRGPLPPVAPRHGGTIEAKVIDLGKTQPLSDGERTIDHDRAPPMYHPEERRLRVDFPVQWIREGNASSSAANHYNGLRHAVRCDFPPVTPEAGDRIKDSQEAVYLIKNVESTPAGLHELQLEMIDPPSAAGRTQLPDENITYIYKRGIATDVSLFGNTVAEAFFDGRVQHTENFYSIVKTAAEDLTEALSNGPFSFFEMLPASKIGSILTSVILPPPQSSGMGDERYAEELYHDICNSIFRMITRCYFRSTGAYCARRNNAPDEVCLSIAEDIHVVQKKLILYEIMSHGEGQLLSLIGQQDTGDIQRRNDALSEELAQARVEIQRLENSLVDNETNYSAQRNDVDLSPTTSWTMRISVSLLALLLVLLAVYMGIRSQRGTEPAQTEEGADLPQFELDAKSAADSDDDHPGLTEISAQPLNAAGTTSPATPNEEGLQRRNETVSSPDSSPPEVIEEDNPVQEVEKERTTPSSPNPSPTAPPPPKLTSKDKKSFYRRINEMVKSRKIAIRETELHICVDKARSKKALKQCRAKFTVSN